jgi:hypothetical protein
MELDIYIERSKDQKRNSTNNVQKMSNWCNKMIALSFTSMPIPAANATGTH